MRFRLLIFALLTALFAAPAPGQLLRVQGSVTSTAPLLAAAPKLRELGVELKIDSERNTSTAIAAVATGEAEVAVATRPVSGAEHAAFPDLFLQPTPIAYQILVLTVSRDVWDAGVRALTRDQVRRIYEGELKNWKEVGGADQPIKFFNPEPGHGVWETFVTWLYGDMRKADLGDKFEKVSSAEETRNVVEFHAGSLSVGVPDRVDGRGTFALAVKTEAGELVPATLESARNQSYPLSRRIDLVSAERPSGGILRLLQFLHSPEGREIIKKTDYVPAEE